MRAAAATTAVASALRHPRARRLPLIVGGVVVLCFLFLAVFPTRTFVAQRDAIAVEKEKVAVLRRENARLSGRVGELQTDPEIERLAREQYSLVKPGEEAYAILPEPGETVAPPSAAAPAPSAPVPEKRPGFVSRVWDGITFWN